MQCVCRQLARRMAKRGRCDCSSSAHRLAGGYNLLFHASSRASVAESMQWRLACARPGGGSVTGRACSPGSATARFSSTAAHGSTALHSSSSSGDARGKFQFMPCLTHDTRQVSCWAVNGVHVLTADTPRSPLHPFHDCAVCSYQSYMGNMIRYHADISHVWKYQI